MYDSSKLLLVFIIIVLLPAALSTGCIGDKSDGGSGLPVKGGSIVIGCDEEPLTLNPFTLDGTLAATKLMTSNTLWGLLVVTPELEYAPRIAESVPTLENGLVIAEENTFTVTYKIKKNAVWSDGTPITSWDIKYTWETIMDTNTKITDRSGYDRIERIYTPDDKTVKLVFREPYTAYKDLFSTTYCILPKHILEGKRYDEILNNFLPFASGPYKFKEWEPGDHLTLVENERFWEDGPNIEEVVFKFIPKKSAQLSSFKNNEIEVLYSSSNAELLDRLKDLRGKVVEDDLGLIWEHVAFNLAKPPLDDVNVRRAIACVVDREKIALEATGKRQALDSIVMPVQRQYYTPAWQKYDFSIENAKHYLIKAGYSEGAGGIYEKDGKPLALTISTTSGDPSREKIEEIMRNDFKAAGIKLEIVNTDRDSFFNSWLPEGNFEIAAWAWLADLEPQLDRLFAADKIPPSGLNYYRYKDDGATGMLKSISSMPGEHERALIYHSIQEKISDDAVVVPLYRRPQVIAYDKRIHGVRNNVSLEGPFWNMNDWWISEE